MSSLNQPYHILQGADAQNAMAADLRIDAERGNALLRALEAKWRQAPPMPAETERRVTERVLAEVRLMAGAPADLVLAVAEQAISPNRYTTADPAYWRAVQHDLVGD